MLRPAVAATNWANAGISGLDMREGGLGRVSCGPGWDAAAKVPARAGAVNDGQGTARSIVGQARGKPDAVVDPGRYLKCGGSS